MQTSQQGRVRKKGLKPRMRTIADTHRNDTPEQHQAWMMGVIAGTCLVEEADARDLMQMSPLERITWN
jgi:hypothetical protein